MFHILAKNWRASFYSFLAVLLWGYEAAGSTPRFCPDTIKLSGSSFIAEIITVAEPPGGRAKIAHKQGPHNITFGKTVISYKRTCLNSGPTKECLEGMCWFNHNSKKCLSQQVADKSKGKCVAQYDSQGCNICTPDAQGKFTVCKKPACFEDPKSAQCRKRIGCLANPSNANKCVKSEGGGGHHVAITKDKKEIGVVELDDKEGKLRAYSISTTGQKDPKKPYLEFQEVNLPSNNKHHQFYKLTVSAYDEGRLIGKYESLSDDRNTGTDKPKNCPERVLDLRDKQFLLKKAPD